MSESADRRDLASLPLSAKRAAAGSLARTLGERVSAERSAGFVGRAIEVELFTRLLGDTSRAMLFITGQVGVGKSALLHELTRVALAAECPVAFVDAVELRELRSTAGRLERQLSEAPGRGPRRVLFVDSVELLGDRPESTLHALLSGLPADTLVVMASRVMPPGSLSVDSGWGRLLLQHKLAPLSNAECARVLELRGVPRGAHEGVLAFASGFPLALAIAADAVQSAADSFSFESLQSAQHRLARFLSSETHSPAQQAVLDVCGVVRATTAELLESVRQPSGASAGDLLEAFCWLGRQSFVDWTPSGLTPHPLARIALNWSMRRERPRRFRTLFQHLRDYCLSELESGQNPEDDLSNLLYLDRNAPIVRTWSRSPEEQVPRPIEALRVEHQPEVVELIEGLEGPSSAQLVSAYLKCEQEQFEVARSDRVDGLLHISHFTASSGPARLPKADPATHLVRRFVAEHPLAEDEDAVFFRWFCDRDGYQSPNPNVLAVTGRQTQVLLSLRKLAYSLCVFRALSDWLPLWKSIGMPWQVVDRFELDQQEYTLVAFDWRRRPLRELLANAWRTPGDTPVPAQDAASFDDLRVMVAERVAKLARDTKLTRREVEILERLCLGLSADDIGRQLSIRPRTVKFHQENLLRKTGVASRNELFRKLL